LSRFVKTPGDHKSRTHIHTALPRFSEFTQDAARGFSLRHPQLKMSRRAEKLPAKDGTFRDSLERSGYAFGSVGPAPKQHRHPFSGSGLSQTK
jgi:hypothetical protein